MPVAVMAARTRDGLLSTGVQLTEAWPTRGSPASAGGSATAGTVSRLMTELPHSKPNSASPLLQFSWSRVKTLGGRRVSTGRWWLLVDSGFARRGHDVDRRQADSQRLCSRSRTVPLRYRTWTNWGREAAHRRSRWVGWWKRGRSGRRGITGQPVVPSSARLAMSGSHSLPAASSSD